MAWALAPPATSKGLCGVGYRQNFIQSPINSTYLTDFLTIFPTSYLILKWERPQVPFQASSFPLNFHPPIHPFIHSTSTYPASWGGKDMLFRVLTLTFKSLRLLITRVLERIGRVPVLSIPDPKLKSIVCLSPLFFTRTYSKKERQSKWPLECLVCLLIQILFFCL